MRVECLEDRAVGRGRTRKGVVQESERGARHEEPPVGVGLGPDRGEVAVADRKGRGQRVGEGQDIGLDVAHGHRAALAGHEPIHLAVRIRGPIGIPRVVRVAVRLARGGHGERSK